MTAQAMVCLSNQVYKGFMFMSLSYLLYIVYRE